MLRSYPYTCILSVDAKGLTFRSETGIEFIDFYACRRNWIKYVNQSDDFVITNLNEESTNCVGQRNIIGCPPYFEFYADAIIRFEFSNRGQLPRLAMNRIKRRGIRNFQELNHLVKEKGWTTFDLS